MVYHCKMNKHISAIIIALFVISSSFAQSNFRDGYIITLENDTISGQVEYRSTLKNHESCLFKNGTEEVEYVPFQILGYGFDGDKAFISQVRERFFVEILVLGELSLYKSPEKYHLEKNGVISDLESIKNRVGEGGKVGTVEDNKWRGILGYLISDCLKNSSTLASSARFDDKSIGDLVVKYNNCKGSEYTEYGADKPWTEVKLGAMIGLVRSGISVTREPLAFTYLADSYSSVDPSFGFLLSVSSPRVSERLSVQTEIHFIKSSFEELVVLDDLFLNYHDTFIELTTLSIPFSIKYILPKEKFDFYAEGGVIYDYHLKAETRLLSERVRRGIIDTAEESIAFVPTDDQIGLIAGFGALKSFDNFKAGLSIRYAHVLALNSVVSLQFTGTTLSGLVVNNNRLSINLILYKK